VRIATWNLERGGRTAAAGRAQDAVLRALAADVIILTEPPASYRSGPGVVTSPPRRRGRAGDEAWVAIVGDGVEPVALEIPFERMATAARLGANERAVVVYGSVLPWAAIASHAPELVRPGESSLDVFLRVLREQASDLLTLRNAYPDDLLVWAGDFNQTVAGPNLGGSHAKRDALVATLADLGLVAWNGDAAHANVPLCAIDLLCGPRDVVPARQGRIDPLVDGVIASDHAGYWVEI
jgi:hypothetical protein